MNKKLTFAEGLLSFMRGDWLGHSFSVEAKRFIPLIMLALYVAKLQDRRLSIREVCNSSGLDISKTGPKYLKVAAERGLITIEHQALEDKRKSLVSLTDEAFTMIERFFADTLVYQEERTP